MRILHIINLHVTGGIQTSFAAFIESSIANGETEHGVVIRRDNIAHAGIPGDRIAIFNQRKWYGVSIPPVMKGLVRRRVASTLREFNPDVVVSWGSLSAREFVGPCRAEGIPLIYWEHGFAWRASGKRNKKFESLLNDVDEVICVSNAAKRMLEIRWRYKGRITLIVNALRPQLVPRERPSRIYNAQFPIVVGVAGRIESVKGMCLAIHAIRELVSKGVDCQLVIAGDGRQRDALGKLAADLGVDRHVRFLGFVSDMSRFFSNIDVFLCPSLREPFGLVSLEAQAHGCPVIVTRVDGLPETILEGESGLSVVPERPLAEYKDYGGVPEDVPPCVYDPCMDDVVQPMFVDPLRLAECTLWITADRRRYQTLSRKAAQWVTRAFCFDRHVEQVMERLRQVVRDKADRA